VGARNRDLDRAPQSLLALDLGEIAGAAGVFTGGGAVGGDAAGLGCKLGLSREEAVGFVERLYGVDREAFDKGRLRGGGGWKENATLPEIPGKQGDGQGAAHRPRCARQTEFAGDQIVREVIDLQLACGVENAEGDGQVVDGTLLPEVARRQVDGRPGTRHVEPAVVQGGEDAILGLLDRGIGQADQDEDGRAGLAGVDLDEHGRGVDALQGRGMDDRQH
jgi:hypothetical protein